MMFVVVGVAPIGGRAGVVPIDRATVERRVVRKVILAMHHVVANLHVVENLGNGERRGARGERERVEAEVDQPSAGHVGAAGGANARANMTQIARSEFGTDLGAEGTELSAKFGAFVGCEGRG